MTTRKIDCVISQELVPTRPDALHSDCLRIEATNKVVLHPGVQTRINLTVHNSSLDGRMAQVVANYDARQCTVTIPTSAIYVHGSGRTVIYAVVTPLVTAGHVSLTFDVF